MAPSQSPLLAFSTPLENTALAAASLYCGMANLLRVHGVQIGPLELIRPLCDSIAELLWLTRQNAKRKSEVAVGGIFQLQFDRENPCQLVRITLPSDTDLFPEMSGNQHRCTIRFLNWLDATARPSHIEVDVPFLLTCCA